MSNPTVSYTGAQWLKMSPGDGWIPCEQGTYTYGVCSTKETVFKATSVKEVYTLWKEKSQGYSLFRVYRNAYSSPHKVELRVEVFVYNKQCSDMTFEVRDKHNILCAQVRYHLEDGLLHWHRLIPSVSPDNKSVQELDQNTLILPLMRNFLGPLICKVAAQEGGKAPLIVPELSDPNADSVFTPKQEVRKANLVSDLLDNITLGERTWNCRTYRFIGGPYDHRSIFWVCQQSKRLIRYIFHVDSGERWSVELTELNTF